MTDNLQIAKEMAQIFLGQQLDMIQSLYKLNPIEIIEFNRWFDTHPYHQLTIQIAQEFINSKQKLK